MFQWNFFYVLMWPYLFSWTCKKNLCETLVLCRLLCTGLNFGCNACYTSDKLFSFRFQNLLEMIWRVWWVSFIYFFFLLRDGLFIAAAVFFGQLDFQCKNESKRMFHDGTHDEVHAMLFVKRAYLCQHAWECCILLFWYCCISTLQEWHFYWNLFFCI